MLNLVVTPERSQPPGWRWDPSLYAGSASYYSSGRVPYPDELVTVLVDALGLAGSERLLDIGCGPGTLTLQLAPQVAEATGVDADADMLAEAARRASEAHISNVSWRHLRAEELPADLGEFELVTLAQSFHWMDRERVARTVREMLTDDGVLVHVSAKTDSGLDGDAPLPDVRPPWAAIQALVRRYLGPQRRAGQGVVPASLPDGEDAVYRGAGFATVQHLEVPGHVVTRTAFEILASVHSLSSAAPHLFGERLADFDAELQALLDQASPEGVFSEEMTPIGLHLWRT